MRFNGLQKLGTVGSFFVGLVHAEGFQISSWFPSLRAAAA
jgi:hypothetical protein